MTFDTSEPIHEWFELSYCSYLVMPRSVLQSMPVEWQRQLVELLEAVPETLEVDDMPQYKCIAVDERGKFVRDPFRAYERGRRRIPAKGKSA